MERIAILVPAFNAAATLPELVRRLKKYLSPADMVVVDDGSTDQTAEVAQQAGVHVLRHEQNFGKGKALRTGFEYLASLKPFEAVVTMDADLQHRPEDLPSFFSCWQDARVDILVGSRARWGTAMPFSRKLSNSITSSLVSARTGVAIRDSQCGFRLITRRVFETIRTTSNGYEAETELLIKAARRGFRIGFVPIETVYAGEQSHMTHVASTLSFLRVLLREY
ncbi:MAG TPA: glycosyltransferase family 2 protein [Bacteroidota bacterium]